MVLARLITRTTPSKYRNLKLLEENIYTYAFSGLVPSEPNSQRLLGFFSLVLLHIYGLESLFTIGLPRELLGH